MNYQQIRAFHLVAQEGSVGRAAEALAVSQPTVSQHLKGLEERHGVRLFDRVGRGLVLTEAGRELFHVTERLMNVAGEVEDLLQRPTRAGGGRLRIIADAPALAVEVLARLLLTKPDLAVSIRKASVDGVVAAVTEMRADVGIAVEPPVGAGLLVQPYRREHLCACLPVGHPLTAKAAVPITALSELTLIQREPGSRTRALVERVMAREGVVARRVIEVEGAEIVREAVAQGLGVSFFAGSDCPPDTRIAYRPVQVVQGRIGFVETTIIRPDRRRVPEIAAFLATAREMRDVA